MNDIDIAREKFRTGGFSFVLINNGEQITSKDRGIKPMFLALTKHPTKMKRAAIADKVIGKAAAMLASEGGVATIYAPLASKGAINICEKSGIEIIADNVVEAIQNREKTGLCPMEKLSEGVASNNEMLNKVSDFLIKINAIKPTL